VHYIDEGEGPPILFLHGNPTWSFLYRGIVIRLRERFRCVALDYPGFGLSEHPRGYAYTPDEHAGVVGELVDHLGLDGVTIMGQDWGGPIGMRVALDRVDHLRALVMGNTWYWPAERLSMRSFAYVMSSQPMQWLITEKTTGSATRASAAGGESRSSPGRSCVPRAGSRRSPQRFRGRWPTSPSS